MFSRHQYLMILISIVPTCTVTGDVCTDQRVYSDIRMIESSKSPLWEVLNTSAGTVKLYYNVTTQPNGNAPHRYKVGESWKLELYHLLWMDNQALANATIQNCSTNSTGHKNAYTSFPEGTASSYWCELKASRNLMISIRSDNCSKCVIKGKLHSGRSYKMCELNSSQDVKWLFSYVYSGWYVLLANEQIVSAPVWLETKYIKQDMTKLNVSLKHINYTTVEVKIRGEALKNDCNNPIIKTSCVVIEIYYQKFKINYNKTEGKPEYCYYKGNRNETSMTDVDWNNSDLALDFRLNDLRPGKKIRLYVKVFDTRCKRGVWAWEHKEGETCVWGITFDVNANDKRTSHVEHPTVSTTSAKAQLVVALIVAIAITVALILLAMSFLAYKRWKNRHAVKDLRRNSVELPPAPQPPSSIFLLYARDCDIFMDTMKQFRDLLRQTIQATVYDIWDNKMRDELDAQGDTWALNYLMSENTQVIVVVTPVSRRIEKLILKNQWSSNESLYNEPSSLDEVFVSAFKTSIRLTHTHAERCRKFIVSRMSSIDCSENHLASFKTLCTIYTLPSLLDSLFGHLFNGHWEPEKLAASVREPFESKIKELEEYIKRNPAYEQKMVPIVHGKRKNS